MKKVTFLFVALLTLSLTTQAQDSCKVCKPYKWEVGLPIGINQYFGDMHCSKPYASANSLMVGAFVRRHLNDYFALRGQILLGKLAGNDLDQPDKRWDYRRLKFSTPLTELAVLGEYYPLRERRYTCDGTFKKTLSPYLFGGLGVAITNPTVTVQPGGTFPPQQRLLDEDKANLKKAALVLPFGVGLKYNVAERWTIGAEAGYRYAFSDYLDGTKLSTTALGTGTALTPNGKAYNDGYLVANLLGSYRFGDKDGDKDGVVDRCDACIAEKGLRKFQGCPDTDGDGIPDKDDACPTQAGPMALRGCPDTDGDGIADKDDDCPTQVGTVALKGCPDRDKDGVADKDDACPDVAGVKALKGCPDTDGDGIADKDDACPNEAGPASLNGCPDTDGDGIADKDDACPTVKGVASAKGCPDRDGDGVADAKDKCPDLAGLASNEGCPEGYVNGALVPKGYRTASGCEISQAELDELSFAAQGVEFYSGTNKLKASSYKKLDRVCSLLQRCPDSILHISAFNDGTNSTTNLRSAKLRACAIYAYFLKKKCISKARMTYEGQGDEDPSSEYTTPDGKKSNTRVQFQLR
jgi:OmpA-OmpF porin, OOP family